MKIGIITLLGNNYGNRLQNYAVQELLSKYGEVYTVKYEKKAAHAGVTAGRFARFTPRHIKNAVNSRMLNKYHISTRNKTFISRGTYFIKHKSAIEQALSQQSAAFKKFDEEYITFEPELLHLNSDDEEPWVKSYDAWVCGSDQIWNPNYPSATRNAFLQFAQPARRIALSASIGISDMGAIPSDYASWIDSIPYVSVREQRAAEIIAELTGKQAQVLLDPTMLLPLEKWHKLADNSSAKLPERFALGYFLGIREKDYMQYIQKQTVGLEYVDLLNGECPDYLSFGPCQMLDAIRRAEIVFVDSFHGAVFSILFHKQFVVFRRSEDGQSMNSRLETLLKRFGLESRIFDSNNLERLHQPIDYKSVDAILAEEKRRAAIFLDNAMMEISKLEKNNITTAKYITISRPEKCSGCTACSQVCPKHCITMKPDAEGFVYPQVHEDICIGCGMCVKVCPMKNHNIGEAPEEVFAAKNIDKCKRAASSSGGVFCELAECFLKNGGIVYGCALDNNMAARHISVENIEDIDQLKSSKYVQSDMGNVMREIKEKLSAGMHVLFSGTPCQVAGLTNYLGSHYDNLLTVDVLCHGVPSPKLFSEYLELQGKKYGGKPVSVNFRNKQHGWKRLYMEVLFDNGNRHCVYSGYDRYASLFLNNTSLRPSCYECGFAQSKRCGDITLGDFWGIGKKYPNWDDDKGISVVMINTENGAEAFHRVQTSFNTKEEDLATAAAGQRTLYAPTNKNPNRDAFYKVFVEEGCEAALEKYTHVPSAPVRAYYAVMRFALDIIRKLLHEGF